MDKRKVILIGMCHAGIGRQLISALDDIEEAYCIEEARNLSITNTMAMPMLKSGRNDARFNELPEKQTYQPKVNRKTKRW